MNNTYHTYYYQSRAYRAIKIDGKKWYLSVDIAENLHPIYPEDWAMLPTYDKAFLDPQDTGYDLPIHLVSALGFSYLRTCAKQRRDWGDQYLDKLKKLKNLNRLPLNSQRRWISNNLKFG